MKRENSVHDRRDQQPRLDGSFLNSEGLMMLNNSTHEFERLLGKAALALWSDFPREVQENLFETAVAGEVVIRNHLASYLHDHHPKTAHPAKPIQLG
jgi:hypothetical protein